jgi:hypothetical protein
LLADPEIGVLQFAQKPAERADVLRIVKLYQRWLNDDTPTQEEWEAAATPESVGENEVMSGALIVVSMAALPQTCSPIGLDLMSIWAARAWQGKKVPAWADRLIGEPIGCLAQTIRYPFIVVIDLLRRSDGGNRMHYQAQAHWLLNLLALRWTPDDEPEGGLFKALVAGDLTDLPNYLDQQKRHRVPQKEIEQMATTLKKMAGLRSVS